MNCLDDFAKRLLYCTTLFSDILPIYDKHNRATIRSIAGADIAEIFPKFFGDISTYAIKNKESSLPYLQFCYESLAYILEYSDEPPNVDSTKIEEFESKLKRQLDWRDEDRNKKINKRLKGFK